MPDPTPWRRLSDWKHEVQLVHLDDLPPALLAAEGLPDPVAQLEALPHLAAALASTGFVRVDDEALATRLRDAGVPTSEVAYHRGVDGLGYASDGGRTEIDVAQLAPLLDDDDDEAWSEVVDAVLRVLSEGLLTEAAVLLAAELPPLGHPLTPDDTERLGALDPDTLPRAPDDLLDRVADALPRLETSSVPGPLPDLTPDQRRAYQRQALGVGLLALVGTGVGLAVAPMLCVLTAPVLVLCGVVWAIHWAILRQTGG